MRFIIPFIACLACANTTAAQYTMQALPPPSDLPANTGTFAYALNNRGQVFGIAFGTDGGPVLWTNGVPARLPVPAGYYFMHGSNASLLSDDGVAVGRVGPLVSGVPAHANFGEILVWENGIPSFLPPVPEDLIAGCSEYFGKTPFGINRAGHIFGMSHGLVDPGDLGSSPCRKFWIYKDGVFEMLPPSDPLSAAGCVLAYEPLEASRMNLLNNADHVALRRRPFNTRSGVDCDPLPPAPDPFPPEFAGILAGTSFAPIAQAMAHQINNHDQVLLAPFAGSAFGNLLLWNGGTLVDFGTNVFAGSMNNLGEVALLVLGGSGFTVSLYGNGVTTSVILPPAAASILANSPASPLLMNDARQLVYSAPGQALVLTPPGGAIADISPPQLTNVPADQTVTAATAAGAIVNWAAPAADDNRDGPVPVVCSPSSGSLFSVGSTTVTCTATDGSGNVGSASFTVTVLPAPPPPGGNQAPIARSVVVATQEAVAKSGALVATDADGDALTFSIVTSPTKGTLSITDASTGAFTYTPNAGTVGYDTFTFQASDGTVASTATGAVFIVAASPRWPGQTVRASIAPNGSELTTPSTWGTAASADGRFIAFSSGTIDEAAGDLDAHVYVYDRQTGQTTLVSKATGSDQSIGGVLPSITPDGRYVGFMTLTSGVPGGDPNAVIDAFIHDRQTGQTTRVNVASDGTPGNGESAFPAISADGRYVAFSARSTNLVAGDTDDDEDVYLRDRLTGQTTLVSVSTAGQKGNSSSWLPIMSADGRYLSFWSTATNLVPGDTNGRIDVFVRDLWTGQTTRVSVGSGGVQLNDHTGGMLSADGRFVVLESPASNAVPGDTNGVSDVFVYDRQSGQTTRVSISSTGAQGMGESSAATISADGRYVAFRSSAPNLVPGDTNGLVDEFVHDRVTGQTVRVNVASDGTQANSVSVGDADDGCCIGASISADGRSVVITSLASNLVAGDTNNTDDVFVVGPVLVSPTTISVSGAAGTHSVNVAADYPGPWTATTTTPWITLNPPVGGSGSGTASFTVAANPGAARTGAIVVALQTVTVSQGPSTPPVAQNGAITTAEDTAVSGTLVATDPDGDPITFSVVTPPARGTVVITDPSTGAFTYTPAPNFYTGDSFTFRALAGGLLSNTATVLVSVSPVNDPPVAFDGTLAATEDTTGTGFLQAHDSDSLAFAYQVLSPPSHGAVSITNAATGAYTYTPEANYNGADGFTFVALDAGLNSNIATVTISVAPVNDAPVASSVVVTTQEGAAQSGAFFATDIDSAALTFSIVTPPTSGTLAIVDATTGAFAYTPNIGAVGYDTFTFQAADGAGAGSSATVMVFIVAASPRWPGQTVRADVATNGAQSNADGYEPVLSADGRYVAFSSTATNLVAGDTNGATDVFVRDRQTGQITRVSAASTGGQGNSSSSSPVISADGRHVAFSSSATNLVAGDTNGRADLFVHDRQSGQTTRASVASDGAQGNSASDQFSALSADGRYVAFSSGASNLVTGDTNGGNDVFVHDRQTGQTTRVSVASSGGQSNDHSFRPVLSADGRYVVFHSGATNLVAGDTNAQADVFVHDRQTGQTTLVSAASDGTQGNSGSHEPTLSADGRYVAFFSFASNLVAGDTNSAIDVFVHDRQTGQTTRVSFATNGAQGNSGSGSYGPVLSADGRYVAFNSYASNLVTGDTNVMGDVFVHDRQTAQTSLVSVATNGAPGNSSSDRPVLSADGRYLAFDSIATNLVANDTNGVTDVFVVGGVSVSPTTVNVSSAGGSQSVAVSFDYPGTPWAATTATPWITIAPPAGGSTNGAVSFSLAPNFGPARTGDIVVALHTVTVTQAAFVDATPPTVTPPAAITVHATIPAGTTPAAMPALAQFLLGAAAVDDAQAPPVQHPASLNGVAITATTVFALGRNTVTFSFSDAAGNVGTASSLVTVVGGRPSVSVAVVGTIAAAGQQAATLRVSNNGTGNALNLAIALSRVRTLDGTGTVTLVSGLPTSIPLLGPGQSFDIPIVVNVPSTVLRFRLSERLTMTDYAGALRSTRARQTIVPIDITAPTVTAGPSFTVTSTTMTIAWQTSEPATSRVDWGQGGSTNRVVPEDSVYKTSHRVTLTNLLPNTRYSFIVGGRDRAGNRYEWSRREGRTNP